MTEDEARERIETLARELSADFRHLHGYNPDGYWLDRKKYRLQDRDGNPIATFHVDTVQ